MAKFVKEKIAQRRVMLFSKKYIPVCSRVKEILGRFNLNSRIFEVVEIESRQDVNQIENYFQVLCLADSREVPHLFIDQKHIGGPKEILLRHRTGELKKILQKIADEEEEFQIVKKEIKGKKINTTEETKGNEQKSFT